MNRSGQATNQPGIAEAGAAPLFEEKKNQPGMSNTHNILIHSTSSSIIAQHPATRYERKPLLKLDKFLRRFLFPSTPSVFTI
jgi:hypothetical protein